MFRLPSAAVDENAGNGVAPGVKPRLDLRLAAAPRPYEPGEPGEGSHHQGHRSRLRDRNIGEHQDAAVGTNCTCDRATGRHEDFARYRVHRHRMVSIGGRDQLEKVRRRSVEIDHTHYPRIGIGRICQSGSKAPIGGRVAPYLVAAGELRELGD
jgi:hypothetical protein